MGAVTKLPGAVALAVSLRPALGHGITVTGAVEAFQSRVRLGVLAADDCNYERGYKKRKV